MLSYKMYWLVSSCHVYFSKVMWHLLVCLTRFKFFLSNHGVCQWNILAKAIDPFHWMKRFVAFEFEHPAEFYLVLKNRNSLCVCICLCLCVHMHIYVCFSRCSAMCCTCWRRHWASSSITSFHSCAKKLPGSASLIPSWRVVNGIILKWKVGFARMAMDKNNFIVFIILEMGRGGGIPRYGFSLGLSLVVLVLLLWLLNAIFVLFSCLF